MAPDPLVTIVAFVWPGERRYGPEQVDVLGAMLARQMSVPYRFVVIADDPRGYQVEALATPPAALELARHRSPEQHKAGFPSSYRRLWLFSDEARQLGRRVMLIDVDVVVTGDLAPLLEPDADFVGWQPGQAWGNREGRLGGGSWLLKTGRCRQVWEDFAGQASIDAARAAGWRGSDQAWISHCLYGRVPVWPKGAGIYSIRDLTRGDRSRRTPAAPADSRLVHFNGLHKPWDAPAQIQHPWILQHWYLERLGDRDATTRRGRGAA